MKNADELREELIKKLENAFVSQATDNRLRNPMLLLYSGSHMNSLQRYVQKSMELAWNNRANSITSVTLDNGALSEEAPKLPEGTVEKINAMFDVSKRSVFDDMNSLLAVYLHDCRDYGSLEAFISGYRGVPELSKLCLHPCMTFSVVLLDEIENAPLARQIRSFLADELKKPVKERISPYTVLLSNVQQNGSLIGKKAEYLSGGLIGSMLVMLNVAKTDFPTIDNLYGELSDSRDYFLTVSYAEKGRPNDEICGVLVLRALEKLRDALTYPEPINVNVIIDRLGLNSSKLNILDHFAPNKPSAVTKLRHLPRTSNNPGAEEMTYKEYNLETCGALDQFYESAIKPSLDRDPERTKQFRKEMSADLRPKVPFSMAVASLSDSVIHQILLQCRIQEPDLEHGSLSEGIHRRFQYDRRQCGCELFREVLLERRDSLIACCRMVRDTLYTEYTHGYLTPEDSTVTEYYSSLINDYEKKHPILQEVVDKLEQSEELTVPAELVLELLKEWLQEFIDSSEIFRKPLDDELTTRTQRQGEAIDASLTAMLSDELESNIRLNVNTQPSAVRQVIFVNQKVAENRASSLNGYLRQKFQRSLFLNTGDSNYLSALTLYAVGASMVNK